MNKVLICPCCGNTMVLVDDICDANVYETDETTLAAMLRKAGYEFGERKGGEKE